MKKMSIIFSCGFGILGLIFFVLGTFSKILPCITNFFEIKDFFTASGSMFAAAALMYTAYCYRKNDDQKNSEFHLVEIKKYFQDVVQDLSDAKNNNIKWHQAIRTLEMAHKLSSKLTEDSHIEMYLTDCIKTGYNILDIVNSIDSYKFFYGVVDYQNKKDMDLFIESGAASLNTSRICPDNLYFLAFFLNKVSQLSYDVNENKSSLLASSKQEYFLKEITENYVEIPFNCVPKITEYIKSYKDYEKKLISLRNVANEKLSPSPA